MENKKFVVETGSIRDILDRYNIAPAEFQRGYVWKNRQKQLLLDSLFKGFPIGIIVLYKDKENDKCYVIDGLQRMNTLKLYYKKPSSIVKFDEFYNKVSNEVNIWAEKNEVDKNDIKKSIMQWYNGINDSYQFEKFAYFLEIFKNNKKLNVNLDKDAYVLEELLNILNDNIIIKYDQVPVIIFDGPKEDLPELFKNINTGSVPLSPFEIYQSMWVKFILNREILKRESEFYKKELEIINKNYETDSGKEDINFNIFKNFIALNYEIGCITDLDYLFKSGISKSDDKSRKFKVDDLSFIIYSTIISKRSNKIDTAVKKLFNDIKAEDINSISNFIKDLNNIILDKINEGINFIKENKVFVNDSKYNSLYILYGLILSEYSIDCISKTIRKRSKRIKRVFDNSFAFETGWFVGENRQVNFFNDKIDSYDKLLN